ncbi:hypothetical protein HN873_037010, partial [Arachis hypogaea]
MVGGAEDGYIGVHNGQSRSLICGGIAVACPHPSSASKQVRVAARRVGELRRPVVEGWPAACAAVQV